MPIKFDLSKYKSSCFIESGTYLGRGCIDAINSGFAKIHTIEILLENQDQAKINLKPYLSRCDITFHFGDTVDVLPEIMKALDDKATFWLDGHGGYPGAGAGKKNCPLMEELDIIASHDIKDHIIMIDDMRIVRAGAWSTPGIDETVIIDKLKKINCDYRFIYEDGVVPDDCLIALV